VDYFVCTLFVVLPVPRSQLPTICRCTILCWQTKTRLSPEDPSVENTQSSGMNHNQTHRIICWQLDRRPVRLLTFDDNKICDSYSRYFTCDIGAALCMPLSTRGFEMYCLGYVFGEGTIPKSLMYCEGCVPSHLSVSDKFPIYRGPSSAISLAIPWGKQGGKHG